MTSVITEIETIKNNGIKCPLTYLMQIKPTTNDKAENVVETAASVV